MTLSELCKKEVIQVATGVDLGRVDDLEFDKSSAQIKALVLFGRPRLFGLLGREPDVSIPWADVAEIGVDVVLVKTMLPAPGGHGSSGLLGRWFT